MFTDRDPFILAKHPWRSALGFVVASLTWAVIAGLVAALWWWGGAP